MSEPIERPVRSRAALALLGAFILGLVCGAAILLLGQRSVLPPSGPPVDRARLGRPMEHLARELGLDREQRRAVRRILERDRARMREILDQSRLEIREILTPEQQERFDRMRPDPPGPRRFPGRGGRPGRPGPGPEAEPPPEPTG
jgi:hypothetical protein